MDIDNAAKLLQSKLLTCPWFTAVGIGQEKGQEAIVLYVTSPQLAKQQFPESTWYGFPVVIRKMGAPRALSQGWS